MVSSPAVSKPLLRVVEGRIAVANVPVPRSSFRLPLWTQNAKLLRELRTVQLAERVLRWHIIAGVPERAARGGNSGMHSSHAALYEAKPRKQHRRAEEPERGAALLPIAPNNAPCSSYTLTLP